MASSIHDKLLKAIGLAQKLFSRSQYDAAKRRLKEGAKGGIGGALVAIGAINAEQLRGLERAIAYRLGREEDKQIAKVMVDSGYATQGAVDDALTRQKELYTKTGDLLRLGVLLVKGGAISESQRKAAIKIHGIERGSIDVDKPFSTDDAVDG